MTWTTPQFAEIKMDAEISSYQDDFEPVRDPLFANVADSARDGEDEDALTSR